MVIDGLPIRGTSLGVVIEHLLEGWRQLDTADRLHLVVGPDAGVPVPSNVTVHEIDLGEHYYRGRVRAQSFVIPKLCRSLKADAMLAILPTTTFTPLPCPRVEIVHDLRYELRPKQFSRKARLIRHVSYEIGYHQADALICISERTKVDLLGSRSYLRDDSREIVAIHHGADHVQPLEHKAAERYAVAYGQHTNKNVSLVLKAWQRMADAAAGDVGSKPPIPLRLFGIPSGEREALEREVAERHLGGIVTLAGWLEPVEYAAQFAGSSLVVFPSDFEGFGLPALEAMQLGIPVVVSPDLALAEVTQGHAVTMFGWSAGDLVTAVGRALAMTPGQIAEARTHAATFTWRESARQYRDVLARAATRASA